MIDTMALLTIGFVPKRREIDTRLAELKPLIDEYAVLEQAHAALASIPSTNDVTAAPPRRRGPGRPRKSTAKPASQSQPVASAKTATGGSKRRGPRPGSGKRANEAFALIKEQPGITVPELAAKMSIQTTYLYRVLPTLETAGKIVNKNCYTDCCRVTGASPPYELRPTVRPPRVCHLRQFGPNSSRPNASPRPVNVCTTLANQRRDVGAARPACS
jgi:hypothetical protein